ncbi:MAG: BREX-1 system adenine-specific DNA-methyltransferase PglX [Lachnospiraceae bacterium]
MNKSAIRNFAIWARNKLIADIQYRAGLMGITADGIHPALPQSTKETEFYDIGTAEPYVIMGEAIKQRRSLVDVINQKTNETNYQTAYKYIMESVAYTWFNRLIAIRFMEINDYLPSHIRVLSSESGKMEPDLVTTPFDADLTFTDKEKQEVVCLKNENNLDECFRLLFIKQCNALNEILPALFEKTADYTELLLNISAIDKEGVVSHLVNDIAEDDFNIEKGGQVEIIGWLYQYYNTELNEQVYDGGMSKERITKELIPAATTIYTPDWAIRYMVENSIGHIWLDGHSNALLKSGWNYYLEEAEQEPEVQEKLDEVHKEYAKLNPEDIHFIDPCMGSGHILVYAFDVLMQIYESVGYSQRDAAKSILENNLYGLDIDDRAYQMAYFAVMMKARQYNRRILSAETICHVYSIQESNHINRNQLTYFGVSLKDVEKKDALNQMRGLLDTFKDAKEYGSILHVADYDWELLRRFIENVDVNGQMTFDTVGLEKIKEKLQMMIDIGEVMARKYEVVVTNPPYFNSSRFSHKLSDYTSRNYVDSKSDLAMIMYDHVLSNMITKNGLVAFITTTSWMYLKSFENIRERVLRDYSIESLVDFGTELFDGKVGHNPIVAWITQNSKVKKIFYAISLNEYCYSRRKEKQREFFNEKNKKKSFQTKYLAISGFPIAYNLSNMIFDAYVMGTTIGTCGKASEGVKTGNNERFLRYWPEINYSRMSAGKQTVSYKWIPHHKGGEYRKWYGNNEWVINWDEDGSEIKNYAASGLQGRDMYFLPVLSWSKITSKGTSFRYIPENYLFDSGSPAFHTKDNILYYLGFLNSKVTEYLLHSKNPTLNCQVGDVKSLPIIENHKKPKIEEIVDQCVRNARKDWNTTEWSWDFIRHPLTDKITMQKTIEDKYREWEKECNIRFNQLKLNEEELNRIFIDIYGLQDELTPEVEDKDITVCKADLQRDIKSLISYAVGCMFGRYSLDVEGLAYAGGDWDDNKYSTFIPDKDNIIPITDEEYFEDDIFGLFCSWLKKEYGKDTLEQNLDFIASALSNKGSTSREIIRNYFVNDFFKDHCTTYSVIGSGKRPIYWLFDSGKQNGFKALIYLHRYNADTIGNLRVDYLHRMQRIYESEIKRMQDMIDHSTNSREVGTATKRREKLQKQLKECRDYDEKIGHLALSRIELDLDDGVKANYRKVQTARDGRFYEVLADSKSIMAKEK